jgi:hypothetical protein
VTSLRNLVTHNERGTYAETVGEESAEEDLGLRGQVRGEWRRLHKEELYALYSSPDIIRVTKPSRMRWAGHVPRMR